VNAKEENKVQNRGEIIEIENKENSTYGIIGLMK
jgi:hypothetical protein